MQLADFAFHLPPEKIAQEPSPSRDASRLMVVPRQQGDFQHHTFAHLPTMLRAGDVLVVNDTQVIPARLRGHKESGGKIEILLDRPLDEASIVDGCTQQRYACLVHASRPLKTGARVLLPDGGQAIGEGRNPDLGENHILLKLPLPLDEYLRCHGEVPLPGYIKRQPGSDARFAQDRNRYQTVYAAKPGAVAAPTAGLHFTEEILTQIQQLGVELVKITLHVGPGTFLPVRCQDVSRHRMLPERYQIGEESAQVIGQAKSDGRRVIAVGTTVVRTLEGAWQQGKLEPGQAETNIFIRPGYQFQVVSGLVTNFHLPESTLIMLVCAFSQRERILEAYQQAVASGYRFYSYGDAMFLV